MGGNISSSMAHITMKSMADMSRHVGCGVNGP